MHPIALGVGILTILLGLFLILAGGIAVIFTINGFFTVSIGLFVAFIGAIIALVGWFL